MVFPRFRHLRPQVDQGTPGQRFFRIVSLTLVLLAVIWGFWTNTSRRMERIGVSGSLDDAAGSLTAEEKERLETIAARFRSAYDLRLTVRILPDMRGADIWDGRSLLIVLVPKEAKLLITAPPLARRALGEEFLAELADSFNGAFPDGPWIRDLFAALAALEKKLIEINQ